MSDCGHECYMAGGPWIGENPSCPIHNGEAVENEKLLDERIAELEKDVASLYRKLDILWNRVVLPKTL